MIWVMRSLENAVDSYRMTCDVQCVARCQMEALQSYLCTCFKSVEYHGD